MKILQILFFLIFVLSFCACSKLSNICDCEEKREQFLCKCTRKEIENDTDFYTKFSISSEQIFIHSKIKFNNIEELCLSKIPIHTFYIIDTNKFNSIKTFSMSSCNITSIDIKSLNGMTNLMFLSFGNNKIAHLHEDTFKDNLELENINLSNNYIENLSGNIFSKLKNLKRINLSNNKISNLNHNTFSRNEKLQDIILNENNIKSLPSSIFQNLTTLNSINLANNEIETLPENLFTSLLDLGFLNLNNNRLSSISPNLLNSNSSLEELYLSNNNLQTISSSILLSAKGLYHFDLANNSLVCDCTLRNFLSVYKSRDISGNITCIKPDHLAERKLSTLSSDGLVCVPHIKRCIEKPKQIACEIFGSPIPDIHWSVPENCKNCHQLSFSNIIDDRYWTNLTILDDTNTQQYILNISNIAGSDHYFHNTTFKNGTLIEVYGTAPKILNCSEVIQNSSDTVTIACSIFCLTSPKYNWMFENQKINHKYNTSIVKNDMNTYCSTLTIPFTEETEGSYTFYVENDYGGNQFIYHLKYKITDNSTEEEVYETEVSHIPKSRRSVDHISLTSPPEVLYCEKYSLKNNITISCKIFGFPVPKITWFFNKSVVRNENEYKHTFESLNQSYHMANLTIFYISSETIGLYSLQVSNTKGMDHEATLVLAEEENSYLMTGTEIITISSCGSIVLISLIIVLYCTYLKNSDKKVQTTFFGNTQSTFFAKTEEEGYQEQIFSTNDSRKNFNSADLLSFNNAFNTVQNLMIIIITLAIYHGFASASCKCDWRANDLKEKCRCSLDESEAESKSESISLENLLLLVLKSETYTRNLDHLLIYEVRQQLTDTHVSKYILDRFKSLESVTFKSVNLKIISKNLFRFAKNVKTIEMFSCNVTDLSSDLFIYVSMLQDLTIQNNELMILHGDEFKDLLFLKVIDLSSNKIHEINENIFDKNKDLQYLNLSSNDIQKLPQMLFNKTLKLKTIDISNNRIVIIDQLLFINLPDLEKLLLQNNMIINFDPQFNRNTALKSINILNNPLDCTCDIKQTLALLKNQKTSLLGTCKDPHNLRNEDIYQLNAKDFPCPPQIKCLYKENIISCKIQAAKNISWTCDGKIIEDDIIMTDIENETRWSNFSIKNKGLYTIRAENAYGTAYYNYSAMNNEVVYKTGTININLIITVLFTTGTSIIIVIGLIYIFYNKLKKNPDTEIVKSPDEEWKLNGHNSC